MCVAAVSYLYLYVAFIRYHLFAITFVSGRGVGTSQMRLTRSSPARCADPGSPSSDLLLFLRRQAHHGAAHPICRRPPAQAPGRDGRHDVRAPAPAHPLTHARARSLPKEGEENVLITSALPYCNNVPHLGASCADRIGACAAEHAQGTSSAARSAPMSLPGTCPLS
jgi:hypothetical protein